VIVRVILPGALTDFAGGQRELTVDLPEGCAVADVVGSLAVTHPALARRIVDETWQLRRFVNVYVGTDECRRIGGLAAVVPAGCDIHVIGSIAGG
jgi:molybdopterin synthase sulfur carrier subunit